MHDVGVVFVACVGVGAVGVVGVLGVVLPPVTMPVPFSAIVYGVDAKATETCTCPFTKPVVLGVNFTVMVQELAFAKLCPQSLLESFKNSLLIVTLLEKLKL